MSNIIKNLIAVMEFLNTLSPTAQAQLIYLAVLAALCVITAITALFYIVDLVKIVRYKRAIREAKYTQKIGATSFSTKIFNGEVKFENLN